MTGIHTASARAWAEDRGFSYHAVHNDAELEAALPVFTDPSVGHQPLLLEAFTDKNKDVELLKAYFREIKGR